MSSRADSSRQAHETRDLLRLVELSFDILCVLDPRGCLERVNPAMSRVLGWSADELLGRPLVERVHPDDQPRAGHELSMLAGPGAARFETRYQRKDGDHAWLAWQMSADPDSGRVYCAASDITALKALEERVRPSERIDAAGSAKTEFLASMNHELRTPLNAILGYTELLSSDSNFTAEQREALDAIKRSGEHLLLLISDILDFARLDANKLVLNPREFLLSGFLQTITELFEARARQKNIAFIHHQATLVPVAIRCDETRLRQVLLNLLSNAIKFTKVGGVIFRTAWDGKRLRFQIEDTGIGIPPSHLEAIFRPFEQIPQDRSFVEGTGLGLSISIRLVELMGGDLHVTSEVSKGSTFWFEIEPEVVTDWQAPPRPRRVLIGYEGPTRKLLIVDDRVENRALLSQVLRAAGFAIIEAADGREAIERARAERPDLIFMDLVMPSLDGFEAIRRIREIKELRSVPIIASSTSRFGDESNGADYDGFLQKPFKFEMLFELLDKHLDIIWRYDPEVLQGMNLDPSQPAIRLPESLEPEVSLDKAELQAIYDAAIIGDIREILVLLDQAGINSETAGNRPYPSLGAELYFLAKGFQGKQIREKLKRYLE
jgi:PAS domain S-box-containing protein